VVCPEPVPLRSPLARLLGVAVVPALVVYVAALVLSRAAGIDDLELVIRDLAQTCERPLAVGLISNLGYLLWMAAATVCLFSVFSGMAGGGRRVRELLLCGGVFSLLLCLDDMFLLHDKYIGADFLYITYAIFALLILFRYRDLVVWLGGPTFIAAVALLGGSILLDKIQNHLPWNYADVQLVEEGLKFLGIACWLCFWWQASAAAAKLKPGT
jgi:hypothetical protein